jgi:Flp pilus assembly protein TadG
MSEVRRVCCAHRDSNGAVWMRKRRHLQGDRGAVFVEFAVVLPILMMLLLGIITGGMAIHQNMQLSHAAREGARYGARVDPEQTFVSGTWASNVRAIIVDRANGDLSGPGTEVCVSLVSGSAGSMTQPLTTIHSTQSGPCNPTEVFPVNNNHTGLRVQVAVARPGEISLGLLPNSVFTIRARATALSEAVS